MSISSVGISQTTIFPSMPVDEHANGRRYTEKERNGQISEAAHRRSYSNLGVALASATGGSCVKHRFGGRSLAQGLLVGADNVDEKEAVAYFREIYGRRCWVRLSLFGCYP